MEMIWESHFKNGTCNLQMLDAQEGGDLMLELVPLCAAQLKEKHQDFAFRLGECHMPYLDDVVRLANANGCKVVPLGARWYQLMMR